MVISFDSSGAAVWNEPARTRRRAVTFVDPYEGVPALSLQAGIFEAWDSPPAWWPDVPALDLQPELLRTMVAASQRSAGSALAGGARPSTSSVARDAVIAAGSALAALRASEPSLHAGSGASCLILAAADSELSVAWVGDLRAYLLRDGVELLTRDHTLQEGARCAGVSPDLIAQMPAGVLTRVLGSVPAPDVATATRAIEPGDDIVLASRSVHAAVDVPVTLLELREAASAHELTRRLLLRAMPGSAGLPLCVVVTRLRHGQP